jgi:hypothetical protein
MKHPNDRNPPVGAPVFYMGGDYGHIAICTAPGRIRSTDCQGAGKVSEVNLDWPEKAWGYPYLGWTGDLSKVALPLGEEDEDDMPLTEQDLKNIAAYVWNYTFGDQVSGEKQAAQSQLSWARQDAHTAAVQTKPK